MIMKDLPKELRGKPLISEDSSHEGSSKVYMGRLIIEFWCEKEDECKEPSVSWSVDTPGQPSERWPNIFLNGLKTVMRPIESFYRRKHKEETLPEV